MRSSPFRRLRRQQSRGAVFAETITVLFLLVLFCGAIFFLHAALASKMDVQHGARRASVYFASHHCSGRKDDGFGSEQGGAGGAAPTGDPAGVELGDEEREVVTQAGGRPEVVGLQSSSSHSFNISSAQRSATVNGAMATRAAGGRLVQSPLSSSPSSEAWVYCNEEAFDGDPIELAKYFFNFAKGMF